MTLAKSDGYIVSFLSGFIMRLIPEAIGYPAPIGYNTVAFYAPVLADFHSWDGNLLINLFYPPQFSPLVYFLTIPFTEVLSPYAVLAIFSPAVYGILALATYHFLTETQGFAKKIALLGAFFVAIQFPVLRMSWDMPSETLAAATAILTIAILARKKNSFREYALITALLVITWLGHQVVLLSVLPCIFYKALKSLRKGDSEAALKLSATSIPTLLFLAWNLTILQGAPTVLPKGAGVEMWFFWTNPYSAGISPFVNYLTAFGSYWIILLTVAGFLLYLYAPLLPPLMLQRPREPLTMVWLAAVLLLAVNPLFSPAFAIQFWYIWAIVLSVPLSLAAFSGFMRILRKARSISYSLVILLLLSYSILGAGFMALPPERPFIYFANSPFLDYSPSSMLSNTMPLQDSLGAVKLIAFLNETMDHRSVLLVHESFYGLAAQGITGDKNIIDYHLGNVTEAALYAQQLGFGKIYWIWWAPGYGWHGLPNPPENFTMIRQDGRMAVYSYSP